MNSWSGHPFRPVTPLAHVGAELRVLAGENGESSLVYESARHPGWLVKRYKPGFPKEPVEVLDRLIALPGKMTDTDRALVDGSICWPVSRVVDGDLTAGVLLAKAPTEFGAPTQMIFGPAQEVMLDIDQLVQTDPEFYRRRGWERPSPRERMAVARNLVAAGALFERHQVVYGDWSYANAFWSRPNGRVFVLDVDACGFHDRPWVESNTWNDPLVQQNERLDVRADRYKIAVLVVRCLTGLRGDDPQRAFAALPEQTRIAPLGRALWRGLASAADQRPTVNELHALLESCDPVPPAPPPVIRAPAGLAVADPPNSAPVPEPGPVPESAPRLPEDRLVTLAVTLAVIACAMILALVAAGGLVTSLFP
ncbi:MAG: hypothetical protein ABIS86_17990 [Streptosporangiaceae bacterium]